VSQAYARIHIHLIFSTRYRKKLISKEGYAARFLACRRVRECRDRLLCEAAERLFLRNACVVAREHRADGFRLWEGCPLLKSRFA
jgi:hypothetical protein